MLNLAFITLSFDILSVSSVTSVQKLVSVGAELIGIGYLVEELLWYRSHEVALIEDGDVGVLSVLCEILLVETAGALQVVSSPLFTAQLTCAFF